MAPQAAAAQTVISSSFESSEGFSEGTLSAQGGWGRRAGTTDVVSDPAFVRSGDQGLRLATGSALVLGHTAFNGSTPGLTGVVYLDLWVKVISLQDKPLTLNGYDLYGGSAKRAFVLDLEPGGAVRMYDSFVKVQIGSWTAGQWHRLTAMVDFSKGKYQASLDGGTFTEADFRESYTPSASGSREAGVLEYHELRLNLGEDGAQGSLEAGMDDVYVGTEAPGDLTFPPLTVSHLVNVVQPPVGEIRLDPSGPTFEAGTRVTATLSPEAGFLACGWLGAEGLGDTVEFTVDGDIVLGAKTCADPSSPPVTRVVGVSSFGALEDALSEARPGDVIELSAGTWSSGGFISVTEGGVEGFPVTIRAAVPGQVTFVGDTHFSFKKTAHAVLEGFVFETSGGTLVKTEASHHIRISRNVFRPNEIDSGKWILIGGSHDLAEPFSSNNRIDHNLFDGKSQPGNFITIDGSASPNAISSTYDRIDHNHFRDTRPRITNGKEAIRVGWSAMSRTSGFTLVEANLFEDCDGDPEIISVKTNDNVIRQNTFVRSAGTLSLRHGDRNTVEGNFFFGEGKAGTGGVRLYGDDHRVYNNYFQGLTGTRWDAPIAVTNGDADYTTSTDLTRHYRPRRAQVVFNTFVDNQYGVEIGYVGSSYALPPSDLVIANNLVVGSTNSLIDVRTAPNGISWSGNVLHATGSATEGLSGTEAEFRLVDPQLLLVDGLWRPEVSSPVVDSADDSFDFVGFDMDGQARVNPDVGADEVSGEAVQARPLTGSDVGVDGPEDVFSTSVEGLDFGRADQPVSVPVLTAFPSPFASTMHVGFRLQQTARVVLAVYDILGRRVETVLDQMMPEGVYEEVWEPGFETSGAFLMVIEVDGKREARVVVRAR
jgi:hypothetical protein